MADETGVHDMPATYDSARTDTLPGEMAAQRNPLVTEGFFDRIAETLPVSQTTRDSLARRLYSG